MKKLASVPEAQGGMRQLTQDDLRWLVCPDCRHPLHLEQTSFIHPHHITCNGCNSNFPIVDGLPVLLPRSGKEWRGTAP